MTDPETEPDAPDAAPTGPAWLPPPDPLPPAPNWLNGRSLPAAWRDTLPFTMGGIMARYGDYPQLNLTVRGWNPEPQPGSDEDVDQAIAAKIHVGMRTLSVIAASQLVVVHPAEVAMIPEWESDEEPAEYAASAELPFSPLYLDLEARDGAPVAWEAESWPLPFHLRGAVCWARDGMLSIVPYGSVGGVHPWGGTDYQAWGRWVFLQHERSDWPHPGPGDSIARPDGHVASWVDVEGESVCAQQTAVTYNLAQRVLRVLWGFEAAGVALETPSLPRPERRRAKRAGQQIGLVPIGLPRWPEPAGDDGEEIRDETPMSEPCPVSGAHARLNQAHVLWHEALDAYNDPSAFVTKLNALIQTVRNITFALQKDLGKNSPLAEWYEAWQARMMADPRMTWAKEARNHIVKQGELDTHSTARVRVVGELVRSEPVDIEVEPGTPVDEIARRITLPLLGGRAQHEGTLIVERRWTVGEMPDDELLDVMAHCMGMLTTLIVEAHTELGASIHTCENTADDPCGWGDGAMHPSGRLACMWAGREARTSRRNLSSGAPTRVRLATVAGPQLDIETLRDRYGTPNPIPVEVDVFEKARILHEQGRRMLRVDKEHHSIVWLVQGREVISQLWMEPADHREQYLGMEFLAAEVTKLGADALIMSAEAWEALAVPDGDPRATLRATEREDRREAFLTHVLRRDGHSATWRSIIHRSPDGAVELSDAEELEETVPPLMRPVIEAWADWAAPA